MDVAILVTQLSLHAPQNAFAWVLPVWRSERSITAWNFPDTDPKHGQSIGQQGFKSFVQNRTTAVDEVFSFGYSQNLRQNLKQTPSIGAILCPRSLAGQ